MVRSVVEHLNVTAATFHLRTHAGPRDNLLTRVLQAIAVLGSCSLQSALPLYGRFLCDTAHVPRDQAMSHHPPVTSRVTSANMLCCGDKIALRTLIDSHCISSARSLHCGRSFALFLSEHSLLVPGTDQNHRSDCAAFAALPINFVTKTYCHNDI